MTNSKVVLTVVVLLGVFTLTGLLGVIWLLDHDTPVASVAIVSGLTGTGLGALATLLASTRSTADPPQDVTVVNPPEAPAQVEVTDV